MVVATDAYLLGSWRLARRIFAPGGVELGRLDGDASFTQCDDAELEYHESGALVTPAGSFQASRVLRWTFDTNGGVTVRFADGRAFHRFSARLPHATHLCGRDRYRVRYRFRPAMWWARWQVDGPAKSYVMISRYTRARDPGADDQQATDDAVSAFR